MACPRCDHNVISTLTRSSHSHFTAVVDVAAWACGHTSRQFPMVSVHLLRTESKGERKGRSSLSATPGLFAIPCSFSPPCGAARRSTITNLPSSLAFSFCQLLALRPRYVLQQRLYWNWHCRCAVNGLPCAVYTRFIGRSAKTGSWHSMLRAPTQPRRCSG